ncbi:MAG: HAMP domain-containing protein [Magnetococcales bacterium]|nr:HAMP domain-containing protein [Magnetococcales bacterium]
MKLSKTSKRWLLFFLLVAVVVITFITARVLHGVSGVGGGDYSVIFLLLIYVNLLLVLVFAFLVIRHLSRLWLDRRRGLTGSKLRTRMVLLFVGLSLLPTLIVAILSVNFLNRGVDSWFSDQIAQALDDSMEVARAYYRENQRTVRHDAEAIVRNRRVTAALTLEGVQAATEVLEVERKARGLDEIVVISKDGTRMARAGELPFDPIPDLSSLAEGSTKALLITSDTGDRVRAFVRLGSDIYLSTGRWIDHQILGQMEAIESAYVDYHQLRSAHGLLKVNHTVILALVTLLLLLAAFWSGFRIADGITDPIAELVIGTHKVAVGDLSVSLSVTGEDELATLMAAFNAMTQKLKENRTELEATNALLEERRRFMAAIVRHISSGVISVNRSDEITLINPAAGEFLGMDTMGAIGRNYQQAIPEPVLKPLAALLKHRSRVTSVSMEGYNYPEIKGGGMDLATQIQIQGPEKPLTLLLRVTLLEDVLGDNRGFIATFDDVTQVLAGQRTQAWSDVARRIAHEIKNPLTPIQLWAQRLRRKYLRQEPPLPLEWKVLDEGTNTIIQQVEELRVLVNEFSTFARLPRPDLKKNDLKGTIRKVMSLYDSGLKKVNLTTHFDEKMPRFPYDQGQIKQVLSNLVANGLAAIREKDGKRSLAISTAVSENGRWAVVELSDSGVGIPPADRDRVFEPYFTTKKKGTGLGLAIVKKIIEDHGGTIRIRTSHWQGVLVEIRLPLSGPITPATTDVQEIS